MSGHRKKCAICGASPLVRYAAASWEALKVQMTPAPWVEGRPARLRAISRALARFHERQDHRIAATQIAQRISGESHPSKALVQKVYRDRTGSEERKRKKHIPEGPKRTARKPTAKKPALRKSALKKSVKQRRKEWLERQRGD